MKIILMNDYFGYWNGRVGLDYMRYLQDRGHRVAVVGAHIRQGGLKREVWEGFEVYTYGIRDTSSPVRILRTMFFTIQAVLDFKKRNGLDVVVSFNPMSALFLELSRGWIRFAHLYFILCPWCLEFREMAVEAKRNRTLSFWLGDRLRYLWESWVLGRVEKILVVSQFTRRQTMEVHPHTASKIEVLPPIVDVKKFSPAPSKEEVRQRLNLPPTRLIFYTMRRLVPRMGLICLLQAFKKVREVIPEATLVIGGAGPLKAALEAEILKLGLTQDVQMPGFIEEAKVSDYYNACDVFVLPTMALEGFGLVIMEALACGTPVLGTPVAAIPEVLGGFDRRLLFQETTPEAMAKKMIEFARNPEWRREVSAKARTYVCGHYAPEIAGPEFERILQSEVSCR